MAETPIQVIRRVAPRYGLDPAAVIAYALTQGGTSWGAVGDNGSSFGPFQAHIGGAAGNRTPQQAAAWANSPEGIEQMMGMMARGWTGPRSGPDAAAFIVGPHFGRGANPASDEAKARAAYAQAQSLLGGSPGAVPTGTAGAGSGAPALPSAGGLPQALPSLPLTKIPGLIQPGFANLDPVVLSTIGKGSQAFTNALVGASARASDAALNDVSGFKLPTSLPKLGVPTGAPPTALPTTTPPSSGPAPSATATGLNDRPKMTGFGQTFGAKGLDVVSTATIKGLNPTLVSALDTLAAKLGKKITIQSGYRSPSYSANVGGYANDPHSRGEAVDAYIDGRPIGEVVSLATLAALGLEGGNSPGFYRGKTDPEHVQIPGSGVNKSLMSPTLR